MAAERADLAQVVSVYLIEPYTYSIDLRGPTEPSAHLVYKRVHHRIDADLNLYIYARMGLHAYCAYIKDRPERAVWAQVLVLHVVQ